MIKTIIGITPVILFTSVDKGHPFFLYLTYSAPHVVIVPRPDKLMKYNLPLRKWKGHIYEGGTRVPAEIAGITDLPDKVDGTSIVPLLTGKGVYDSERTLFWHYPHFSNQLGHPAGSVRAGDYKLVENYETGELELYNLKEDISETADLSKKLKKKTQELYNFKTLKLNMQKLNLKLYNHVQNPLFIITGTFFMFNHEKNRRQPH